MPEPQPQAMVRKRASKPKVRTGCVRCKARRVKCDESKPTCSRCTKSGALCSYQEPVSLPQRHTQRPLLPAPAERLPLVSSRLAKAALYTLPSSAFSHLPPQDVKYLDYFIRNFRGQLSLSRLGDSALSSFWSTTVPQQGEQDSYVLDAILAVGALAWARRSAPLTGAPLVEHRLSGALKNEHYRKALKHYSRAAARTQQALQEATAEARLLVAVTSCMLFYMFEQLQDNTSALDRVGASGLDILPHLASAAMPGALRSSTEAVYSVLSGGVIQTAFSPMNRLMRPRILNIPVESVLQPPAVPSPARSLQEFAAVWWRFVITMLNLYCHSAAFGDGFNAPSYSPSQISSLLALISSWETEARRRAAAVRDFHSIRLLQAIANMASRLMRSVKKRSQPSAGSPKGGGATTPLDYSAILELYKISKRHQADAGEAPVDFVNDVAQEAALPALFYVARWCPDCTTRLEALDICRALLRPASSFNLKAVYMVMRALVDMEGESEEPAIRYNWTEGSWNDDYTALHVTLTPTDQQHSRDVPGTKHMVLSVREYGF